MFLLALAVTVTHTNMHALVGHAVRAVTEDGCTATEHLVTHVTPSTQSLTLRSNDGTLRIDARLGELASSGSVRDGRAIALELLTPAEARAALNFGGAEPNNLPTQLLSAWNRRDAQAADGCDAPSRPDRWLDLKSAGWTRTCKQRGVGGGTYFTYQSPDGTLTCRSLKRAYECHANFPGAVRDDNEDEAAGREGVEGLCAERAGGGWGAGEQAVQQGAETVPLTDGTVLRVGEEAEVVLDDDPHPCAAHKAAVRLLDTGGGLPAVFVQFEHLQDEKGQPLQEWVLRSALRKSPTAPPDGWVQQLVPHETLEAQIEGAWWPVVLLRQQTKCEEGAWVHGFVVCAASNVRQRAFAEGSALRPWSGAAARPVVLATPPPPPPDAWLDAGAEDGPRGNTAAAAERDDQADTAQMEPMTPTAPTTPQ